MLVLNYRKRRMMTQGIVMKPVHCFSLDKLATTLPLHEKESPTVIHNKVFWVTWTEICQFWLVLKLILKFVGSFISTQRKQMKLPLFNRKCGRKNTIWNKVVETQLCINRSVWQEGKLNLSNKCFNIGLMLRTDVKQVLISHYITYL